MTWMADWLVKSTLVLAGAWLVAMALRRSSAAARHAWWCAAVAALTALPLLMAALPKTGVRVPGAAAGEAVYRFTAAAVSPGQAADLMLPERPAVGATVAKPSWNWNSALVLLWWLGTLAMLLRLAMAHAVLARMRREALPLEGNEWTAALADAAAQLGLQREVRLLRHAGEGVPMTAGVRHPVIYLPAGAQQWDAERRRVVLIHELAHVKRYDALTSALAKLALAGYWFHPLAWAAGREVVKEREHAADDLVLATGTTASGYAGHLLEIAAKFSAAAPAEAAAVCMARPSHLEGRLRSILDAGRVRGSAHPLLTAAMVTAAVLAVMPLAGVRAQAPKTAAERDLAIRSALSSRDYAAIELLAAELVAQHKYEEANRISDAALEIRSQRFGAASREYAEGLTRQADLLRREGQWEAAGKRYRDALALQEAAGAPTAEVLGASALIAQQQKSYAAAEGYYTRALALQPEPRVRAGLLTGLGLLEREVGRDAEAEQHYREALLARGEESPATATTLELLASLLQNKSRAAEAEPLLARASALRKTAVAAANRPAPAASEALKVGGAVQAPSLLHKIEPQYSEVARAARYQGTVRLGIVVSTDGRADNIELLKGIGLGLDEQAAEAVRQWEFRPATMNGTPVAVKATIEINFKLM